MDFRFALTGGRGARQHGFTLVELAIALAVVGAVAGGIWVAASAAINTRRVNQTIDQVQQIAENVRGFYSTAMTLPNQPYDVFTQTMAAADIFPAETRLDPAIDPTTCSIATPCYFAHPWSANGAGSVCNGGTICLTTDQPVRLQLTGNNDTGFVLLLRNLPQDACVRVAGAVVNLWEGVGIAGIGFNNGDSPLPAVSLQAPPAPAAISASCAAGNGNSLYLAFRRSGA